ncbi:MAG: hypothetical protein HFI13_12245 [Lachnospiraceae bacterium]|nr:hypothetical protein [Lachnospiraceae bacterium]MCI9659776.1 hypothetical protein [Lachnospiraceae bacterium]
MDREDYEEIKQEIEKILTRYKVSSSEQWDNMDGWEACEVYESLKAGVVEVFNLDDDEMGEALEEVLESMSGRN